MNLAVTDWSIATVADTLAPDCDLVRQRLREHNWSVNPVFMEQLQQPEHQVRSLVLLAAADGRIVGGLFAEAERQAVARGCKYACVDTMEYQAPSFYLGHCFATVREIPDWDSRGHSKLYPSKRLNEPAGTASA